MTAAPVPPRRLYTIAEYVAFNETATDKHEYHDGEILAMSGGSVEHSRILKNTIASLTMALRGRPCENFESNLRVRVPATRHYFYPDSTIICGPIEYDPEDPSGQSVTNPRAIIEVLSPSTEAYDRGKKFNQFRRIEALQEYVLISQTSALVETFVRQSNGSWLFTPFSGIDATLTVASVDVEIPLAEIYRGVTFPPPAPPPPGSRDGVDPN
jgi:Uma2 family endonuclease